MRAVAKRQILASGAAAVGDAFGDLFDYRRFDQVVVRQRHSQFPSECRIYYTLPAIGKCGWAWAERFILTVLTAAAAFDPAPKLPRVPVISFTYNALIRINYWTSLRTL